MNNLECAGCDGSIASDENCYEITYGHNQEGIFEPKSDLGIFHSDCFVERSPSLPWQPELARGMIIFSIGKDDIDSILDGYDDLSISPDRLSEFYEAISNAINTKFLSFSLPDIIISVYNDLFDE